MTVGFLPTACCDATQNIHPQCHFSKHFFPYPSHTHTVVFKDKWTCGLEEVGSQPSTIK